MRNLESRGYLATDNDVVNMAESAIAGSRAPATYLRVLVAATIAALGAEPLQRTRARTLNDPKPQLAALAVVHERFYTIVLRVAATVPVGKERNRATNFARSSISTLRAWIRAGNDITGLVPAKVTKASLAIKRAAGPPRKVAPRLVALAQRMDKLAAQAGPEAARDALEAALQVLSARLMEWSGKPSTEPAIAVRERRPLRTRAGTFWPTEAANEARAS